MIKRKAFRFGAVVGVLALAAMACTCGALTQAQQGVQTAQALATQGNQLVTQAQGFATEGVALATQLEQSGALKTAAVALTQVATSAQYQTVAAAATEAATTGNVETLQAVGATALAQLETPEGTDLGATASPEVPDDIPIYPDNTEVQNIGGIITYQANANLTTVTKFYATELPKNDWTQAQAPLTSGSASILFYKKSGRELTLTLLNTQSSVTVTIQVKP